MPERKNSLSLEGLHVLVVDDDEDARVIMEVTLRSFGSRVTTAASAELAHRALSQAPPDVIVSDLAMPDQDGVSFIRELRRHPDYAAIPVLAVTAYGHRYSQHQLRAAGFTGLLRKPLNPADLGRTILALAHVAPPREGRRG